MPEANVVQWDADSYRYLRNSFYEAGQDSYDTPPGQNTDLFDQLVNTMPVTRGALERRWGTSFWLNPGFIARGFTRVVDNVNNPSLLVLGDTTASLYDPDGNSLAASIFTGTAGADSVRALASRGYVFMADGLSDDAKKHNGLAGASATKWGIAAQADTGPNSSTKFPTVAADVANGYPNAWVNPNNVKANDSTHATVTITSSATVNTRRPTTYARYGSRDFSLPTKAYDTDTATSASGLINQSNQGTGKQGETYSGLTQPGGVVSLVQLKIDSSIAVVVGSAGHYAVLQYSINGGSTWSTIYTTGDTRARTVDVITLSNALNIANIKVRAQLVPFVGDPPSDGSIVYNLFDVRVEVTTGSFSDGTHDISTSAYAFTIPAGVTVTGINVTVQAKKSSNGSDPRITCQLLKASGAVGVVKDFRLSGSTFLVKTPCPYGNSGDKWGTTWSVADVNSSGFGVRFYSLFDTAATQTLSVDCVTITVYYTAGMTIGTPVAGNITVLSGRIYALVYGNSATGGKSDIFSQTISSGPQTAQNLPLTGIPVSSDSQVNTKFLIATADGGDTSKWYLVAELAASATTYTDSMPEATLLVQSVFQETDEFGNEHGCALNNPPPAGRIMCKHRGRLFMLTGSALYFSKNNDELTTSTGDIQGKYEECWPGDFQMDVSGIAETGSSLFSDGVDLYVGTERRIRKISGDGPENFSTSEVVFNEVGVLNADVFQVAFAQGQPIGALLFTPDLKVIRTDFNTYMDVGTPIQDVLNSVNRAAVQSRAKAVAFSAGAYSFYALALPTGSNTECDTICLFDLNRGRWHTWDFPFNVTALLFDVKEDGTPRLFIGADTNKIYLLNQDLTIDGFGDSEVAIPVTIVTHWLHFGDPTGRKDLNEIEITTQDPALLVTIEGASNYLEFSSADVVVANAGLVASPLGDLKVYLASTVTKDRFYRFTFLSAGGVTRDVLDGINVELISENKL